MSKKDYVLIAECLKESNSLSEFIDNLIPVLQEDNERFDKKKFLEYLEN